MKFQLLNFKQVMMPWMSAEQGFVSDFWLTNYAVLHFGKFKAGGFFNFDFRNLLDYIIAPSFICYPWLGFEVIQFDFK